MTVISKAHLLRRRFGRFKTQYLISFSGLFLATTVFLLLLHFITYHYSFDRFHRQANAIVRLNTVIKLPEQQNRYAATAFAVGPEIADLYPEVERTVRLRYMPGTVEYQDLRFDEGTLLLVDSSFLEVFSFEVLTGKANSLHDPDRIVIRRELAEKYFPGEDPVGKTLRVTIGGQQAPVTIGAVVADPPPNSSIDFQMLLNIRRIEDSFRPGYASLMPGLFTYFQLRSPDLKETFAAHLQDFVKDRLPENLQSVMSFYAMPLREMYFERDYQFDTGVKGNKDTLISLLVLALITLAMAVINYVNISTTLGVKRSKEIAVQKILGSTAGQIAFNQYLDSLVIIALTLVPAALVSKLLLPRLDTWLELELTAGPLNSGAFWGLLFIFAGLLSALAAAYPAFVLSRLSITEVLKRNMPSTHLRFDFKKVLLGFQFAVAVFFLTAAWIVYYQLEFLRQKDPGFHKEQVLLVDVAGPGLQNEMERIKQQLGQVSGVTHLSASTSGIYGVHTQANFSVPTDSLEQSFLLDINYVDPDFLNTYGVELLAGRNFSKEILSDRGQTFILNEAAVKRLGFNSKEEVLGHRLRKIARDTSEATVIGVVGDYHFQSMHQLIAPMVWQVSPDAPKNVLAIRVERGVQNIVSELETQWAEANFGDTFDFTFLDETMANAYRSEQQMGLFIRIISAVLLFITCSGLYGLMLFLVEQKTREIGIRKTFGAGNWQIQLHLYRQYLLLTILGIGLGGSLAYWMGHRWLQNFAYHTDLRPLHVLTAGLLCLLLGWLSISLLSFRAGRINPVESMRER